MGQIIIRNLPDAVINRLNKEAADRGMKRETFVRMLLIQLIERKKMLSQLDNMISNYPVETKDRA